MDVKIKLMAENAKMPTKVHKTDAGFDLYCSSVEMVENSTFRYHTGVAMEIPFGYVGLVFPRSSVYKTDLIMANCVGVIDSGYRGEIMAQFKSDVPYDPPYVYKVGDRVAQVIIMPYPEIEFIQVDELSESDRGVNGHGSSGK